MKAKESTLEALDTGRHKELWLDRVESQGRQGQEAASSTQEFAELIGENKRSQKAV